MSDMVERLAKRWREWIGPHRELTDEPEAEARWWLNTVADELEAMAQTHGATSAKWYSPADYADYFRTQAREDTPEPPDFSRGHHAICTWWCAECQAREKDTT